MSDQDTTVTPEDSNETAPEPSRFKKALNKVAPYAPHIATAVVAAVSGALLFKAINEAEKDVEEVVVEEFVIDAEPEQA